MCSEVLLHPSFKLKRTFVFNLKETLEIRTIKIGGFRYTLDQTI